MKHKGQGFRLNDYCFVGAIQTLVHTKYSRQYGVNEKVIRNLILKFSLYEFRQDADLNECELKQVYTVDKHTFR